MAVTPCKQTHSLLSLLTTASPSDGDILTDMASQAETEITIPSCQSRWVSLVRDQQGVTRDCGESWHGEGCGGRQIYTRPAPAGREHMYRSTHCHTSPVPGALYSFLPPSLAACLFVINRVVSSYKLHNNLPDSVCSLEIKTFDSIDLISDCSRYWKYSVRLNKLNACNLSGDVVNVFFFLQTSLRA